MKYEVVKRVLRLQEACTSHREVEEIEVRAATLSVLVRNLHRSTGRAAVMSIKAAT